MFPLARIPLDAIILLDEKPHSVVSLDAAGLVLRPLDDAPVTCWLSHDETVGAFYSRRLRVCAPSDVLQPQPASTAPFPSASLVRQPGRQPAG